MPAKRHSVPPLFPMFLRLAGRHCVVVGAGKVTEAKIASLLRAGANVTVIAPKACEAVAKLAHRGRIAWHLRSFRAQDLRCAFLVVAATSSNHVHESVRRAATQFGVLCNIADDPERCDFYYPAIVRRGALQIAISTSGESPALAQQIRRDSMQLERSPRRRKGQAHTMARATLARLQSSARKQAGNRA
jgi:precorrin-2 dehydrogenase / sirohydrochlorin ferrochelatase